MASNPKWWEDNQEGKGEAAEPNTAEPGTIRRTDQGGSGVEATEDMTHEQLDKLAEDLGVDVPAALNKAEKVEFINNPDNRVV